ncbi:MAG: acyl-CoA dehydrogenase family protein [Pseudomonadota bacterium]
MDDIASTPPADAVDDATMDHLADTVRRFVREELVPLERQVDEEDLVPDHIVAAMKELGLFGISIPQAYGGLGLTASQEMRLARELGWTSPAFRSVFGTNIGIGSQGILIDGTPEQKEAYLPKIASGELIGSFALTEAEAGSDAASLKTTATRDGSDYILNGTKRYITNARRAGVFTLMARSEPDVPGARGISAFIVDADSPGLSVGPSEKKMGQRGAHVSEVMFDNVRVPAANIIGGEPGKGFITAMKVLDRGRLHISAICIGAARRLIHEALGYTEDRKQFGRPLADFQLVQAMIADSHTECYAAEGMVADAAAKFDRGETITLEVASCKMYASEMAGRVADRVVQIFGGSGYIADYGIERFYRDVRLFRLYEGTTQIQQLIIARELRKAHAQGSGR